MSIPQNIIKTDEIWFKETSQLYRLDRLTEFFPHKSQTQEERLNSIARLGIYAGILLSLYKRDYSQFIWSLYTLLYIFRVQNRTEEGKDDRRSNRKTKTNAQQSFYESKYNELWSKTENRTCS